MGRESINILIELDLQQSTPAIGIGKKRPEECKKLLEAKGAKNGEAPFNPAYLTTEVGIFWEAASGCNNRQHQDDVIFLRIRESQEKAFICHCY